LIRKTNGEGEGWRPTTLGEKVLTPEEIYENLHGSEEKKLKLARFLIQAGQALATAREGQNGGLERDPQKGEFIALFAADMISAEQRLRKVLADLILQREWRIAQLEEKLKELGVSL
jgi:hypothetical protein